MSRLTIQIKDIDNVAIATKDLEINTVVENDIKVLSAIPQGHKVLLKDLKKGDAIIRYGVTLGYLLEDMKKGSWVNEHHLELPLPPKLNNLPFGEANEIVLPKPKRTTFLGYKNENNFGGTRNILGISTTVQCVSGILDVAVDKIKNILLPKYPNVDDVVAVDHAYGCGVAIEAPEAIIPIRSLRNFVHNPNFGGQVMVIALGCEKFTVQRLLDAADISNDNVIVLQDLKGFNAMIDKILEMADQKLAILNARKREELPLSDLILGAQCGGSDAFSGVTGNPVMGYASDLLVAGGATVMFSEVTEVRDGVEHIARRCVNKDVVEKLSSEMQWYDDYLSKGQVDRSANPTPGNKKGGLSNIVEKAMGSIAKSGTAPIVEVLSTGERPSKKGLIFAATPASDIVCGPSQLASGITMQIFITGRGTPYGLAAAPVIKVSTRNEMKNMWFDLIDFSAGPLIEGDKTLEALGEDLFNLILDVASGQKTFAEEHGLKNFMSVFNPAPIT